MVLINYTFNGTTLKIIYVMIFNRFPPFPLERTDFWQIVKTCLVEISPGGDDYREHVPIRQHVRTFGSSWTADEDWGKCLKSSVNVRKAILIRNVVDVALFMC